jgi:ADP-ribosylglycohydrolase
MMDLHDSFKACLLGGAIGDALGYPTLATADT